MVMWKEWESWHHSQVIWRRLSDRCLDILSCALTVQSVSQWHNVTLKVTFCVNQDLSPVWPLRVTGESHMYLSISQPGAAAFSTTSSFQLSLFKGHFLPILCFKSRKLCTMHTSAEGVLKKMSRFCENKTRRRSFAFGNNEQLQWLYP